MLNIKFIHLLTLNEILYIEYRMIKEFKSTNFTYSAYLRHVMIKRVNIDKKHLLLRHYISCMSIEESIFYIVLFLKKYVNKF